MAKVNRKASEHVNEKTSDLFKRLVLVFKDNILRFLSCKLAYHLTDHVYHISVHMTCGTVPYNKVDCAWFRLDYLANFLNCNFMVFVVENKKGVGFFRSNGVCKPSST